MLVKGRAQEGGKAYLWVEGATSTYNQAWLPTEETDWAPPVEFVAPVPKTRIGILISGPSLGQTFCVEQLIITAVNYPDKEWEGHPVISF